MSVNPVSPQDVGDCCGFMLRQPGAELSIDQFWIFQGGGAVPAVIEDHKARIRGGFVNLL